jgi:voltage-dependent anion channel protein 2
LYSNRYRYQIFKNVFIFKLSLDTNFAPATGSKGGRVKAEYKHDTAALNADMDLGLSALNASAVVGHKGWLAGYQTTFDISKSAITKVR